MRAYLYYRKVLLIIFITLFTYPNEIYAQDTLVKPLNISLTDSLEFNKETEGFLKKVLQTIKFKENRDSKEQERIYQFVLKLIEEKDLNIDLNLNEIATVLDSIQKADSLKFHEINTNVVKNKEAIDSLKIKAEASFKVALDSVINEQLIGKKLQQDKKEDSLLKKIKSVKYTCECLKNKRYDTIYKYCLKPKTKIIGWHNIWSKEKYKNYNFNYLSALNLYGYELDIDGSAKNQDEIDEFKKTGGVIEFAQSNGTDVYLTIFNKYPLEINKFLNDSKAQENLVNKLFLLYNENCINGVNIYFEGVLKEDADRFSLFIKTLYSKFEEYENLHKNHIDLHITIPAIYNDISLVEASAYNFAELNLLVDYYLISTDRMTRFKNNWAQPENPLNGEKKSKFGTINSTVNFYSNGKIPLNKIIISVSYLGIEWTVINFIDSKVDKNYKASYIGYSKIISSYKNNKDFKSDLTQGFDSIQAAAFLNIKREVANFHEPKYTQIWYEDSKSLKIKYNWVLENKLGGVSIRGLGYDDGYTDLWDAIGSTLIEIESTKSSNKNIKEKNIKTDPINSNNYVFMLSVFIILISVFLLYRKYN